MERNDNDNVTELRPLAGFERINGVLMCLGEMCVQQLEVIEASCQRRATAAHDDAWIVQSYLERLAPPSGDAA